MRRSERSPTGSTTSWPRASSPWASPWPPWPCSWPPARWSTGAVRGAAPPRPGPGTSCAATARAPSTTSPCAATSSGSSTATASWPTPSTAASAWCRPTPSGPRPNGSRCGAAFRRFADDRGWVVTVMGASEHWLPDLPGHGHARHLHRRRSGGRRTGVLVGRRSHEGPAPGPQPHRQVRLYGVVPRPRPTRPGHRRTPHRAHVPEPAGRIRARLLHGPRPDLRPPRRKPDPVRGDRARR